MSLFNQSKVLYLSLNEIIFNYTMNIDHPIEFDN